MILQKIDNESFCPTVAVVIESSIGGQKVDPEMLRLVFKFPFNHQDITIHLLSAMAIAS
jgi:hypothetical protein